MATTTNYGWTTPDDTALVKDGASAIRTLGTSVDTTTKNLNPSTTLGDIEYRSSTANTNTRLGIGTSGQALTVVAGAPSWAASATSVLTTTGDTLYASGANTLARLAIGSTGQVLTVAAGLPSWATSASGGMTLISTTTLSGVTTTLSSIPQTYVSLYLVVTAVTGNTSNGQVRILPNNVNNLSNYGFIEAGVANSLTNTTIRLSDSLTTRTDANNAWAVQLHNYTSTTTYKPFSASGFYVSSASANLSMLSGGAFRSNTAITSIVLDYGGTNTFAGGTVLLYGVK